MTSSHFTLKVAEIDEDQEEIKKELKDAFRLYDKEGNGYIPNPALQEILDQLDKDLDLKGLVIDSVG